MQRGNSQLTFARQGSIAKPVAICRPDCGPR
jgi:hypothetical protein